VIYQAPGAFTAASVPMMLGASVTAATVETAQLFTTEEATTATTKAARKEVYR
jgi:hypothetical protein